MNGLLHIHILHIRDGGKGGAFHYPLIILSILTCQREENCKQKRKRKKCSKVYLPIVIFCPVTFPICRTLYLSYCQLLHIAI